MFVPAPDPAPNTGTRPVTYQSYSYVTAAVSRATGETLPYTWFRCTVGGRRRCVMFRL